MATLLQRAHSKRGICNEDSNLGLRSATISALNTLKNTAEEQLIDTQMQSTDHTVKENKETARICLGLTITLH